MFLAKFQKILFYSLVFLLPTQLGYHLWPQYAFIFGVRVDYLAPTIYLTDILLILLLAVSRTKIKTTYLLGILFFALINIFISISPWVSAWKWLKIVEVIFFAKYVYDNFDLVKKETFSLVLSLSLILTSTLGLLQVVVGRTLGGIFYLMGERSFNLNTPGIALQTINGSDYMRAYSSFSHPNSLAGFLLLGIMYLISLKKKNTLVKASLIISSLCFILTFSQSAFIAAFLTSVFFILFKRNKELFKKTILFTTSLIIFLSFALPFISVNPSYQLELKERLEQADLARDLIVRSPLLGMGVNTFTILNRTLQPVHNIFLLVLAETGVVVFIVFLSLIYKSLGKKLSLLLMPVLVIGFFDHYFLTLQQNLLSLSFLFGAIFAYEKSLKSKHAKRNIDSHRRGSKR